MEMRQQVLEVFKRLRKQGLVARANHWCCQTCGGYSIGQHIDKNPGKFKGYVFWHNQDEARLREDDDLFLAWGSSKDDASDQEAETIGKLIVEELSKEQGLFIIWNGSRSDRIRVRSEESLKNEIKKCERRIRLIRESRFKSPEDSGDIEKIVNRIEELQEILSPSKLKLNGSYEECFEAMFG